ncbi:Uncharacterized NAD(P)/FAD-binding protein YdhS [Chitinophaga sp. YR573]|uniref:FAD/NAD(P)-binding protein n=1 Tax=Chitinophaga sp. YR573 TaxID=1881040 RepID=UPI0008D4AC4D|nr:FAD/NAD(P)-binding protein [Chitinophaga sp. YR573]SEV89842.1 Uncharacterized NAD(P)/FAD-binding protein YdhS [Chitinophaga sp. YR573]
MRMKEPLNITIIGGGFCGIMTAINLMKDDTLPLHIHIVNKGYPIAKGVAYAPHTSSLLLNVPNGRMSAYTDIPDHYVQWLKANALFSNDEIATAFSTREQYGNYLSSLWEDAIKEKGANTAITIYDDYAYDIIEDGDLLHIHLKESPVLTTDLVILATGNAKPRFPFNINSSFRNSKHYFGNPWKKDCIENLNTENDVLIIGNGLSMVDTVIGLTENGFAQNIHTVSPHGYQLKPWKGSTPPYRDINFLTTILNQNFGLRTLVTSMNRHRKIADTLGQSVYSMIDVLRPHTQKIWQSLSIKERNRFIKYLNHIWGSIRHRLPDEMHAFIKEHKKLIIHRGHIVDVSMAGDQVKVTLSDSGSLKHLLVQRVINCTGPETNIQLSENELLRNLEKRGLISADVFHLGINAHPQYGNVMMSNDNCKHNLFVIGNHLKGVLWESAAIPELRMQTEALSKYLITKYS